MAADDIRPQQAHAMPIAEVVDRLGLQGLSRSGGELVGPCPQCGGTDRFGVNLQRGVFQCRKDCGANCKGDQIALVQFVLNKSFPEALEWLIGPREELSSAERREIERKAEANRRARAEAEAHMRRQAIAAARDIWSKSTDAEGSLYDQAVSLVTREGKASTSFVQRHLNIGYNRAAKLIEQMEKEGVVGPANHVGKREVLAPGPRD